MEQNPFTGDIQRLENQSTAFRRRVGDWRIFFDVHPEQRRVEVTHIVRRTTTTYRGRRVVASRWSTRKQDRTQILASSVL